MRKLKLKRRAQRERERDPVADGGGTQTREAERQRSSRRRRERVDSWNLGDVLLAVFLVFGCFTMMQRAFLRLLGNRGDSSHDPQYIPKLEKLIGAEDKVSDTEILSQRAGHIRDGMRFVWGKYRTHAWGKDNLMPMTGRGIDAGFDLAITMVDSLDTLWIMGLKDEFTEAKDWLVDHLPERIARIRGGTSVFETTIRSLGGLLAAFDLSRDASLLQLATQVGDRVVATMTGRGITPYTFSGGLGGNGGNDGWINCRSLAESGSSQLEMNALSHFTGDPKFAKKSMAFYSTVHRFRNLNGLWPNCWEHGSGRIGFGSHADSFYEYLIKTWLMTGKTDDDLWTMYNEAIDGLERYLIGTSSDGLKFVNSVDWTIEGIRVHESMEHLTCFVPGWLALGIPHQQSIQRKARHLRLAEDLAYTCWQMYDRQPTGIGPERVRSMNLSQVDRKESLLRPEAIESWWYLAELTNKPKYREWGWRAFVAFSKHMKVAHGYASLRDVTARGELQRIDRMDSYFLAETMKYLYLLQEPTKPIQLDRYVLNTQGHPLSIFEDDPRLL